MVSLCLSAAFTLIEVTFRKGMHYNNAGKENTITLKCLSQRHGDVNYIFI
jgi:hypothetical protein